MTEKDDQVDVPALPPGQCPCEVCGVACAHRVRVPLGKSQPTLYVVCSM